MQDKQPHHPLSPIKHSMKRRCHGHDYSGKGLYMITLVVRGRRRLLGTLDGGIGNPHVHLSALGESVEQCVLSISKVHPEVEVWKRVYQNSQFPDFVNASPKLGFDAWQVE